MSQSGKKPSGLFRLANLADFFNERVIHTPYLKSTIYFLIALAVCLLVFFLITNKGLTG